MCVSLVYDSKLHELALRRRFYIEFNNSQSDVTNFLLFCINCQFILRSPIGLGYGMIQMKLLLLLFSVQEHCEVYEH